MDQVALELQLTLRPAVAAPGVARHVVRGFAPILEKPVLESTELLVTELVTNSLRHSGSPLPIELRLTVTSTGSVRGEVLDLGDGFRGPPGGVRFPGTGATSGWGLYLVEHIAQRWGVLEEDGTTVWFEIDPPPDGHNGKARGPAVGYLGKASVRAKSPAGSVQKCAGSSPADTSSAAIPA